MAKNLLPFKPLADIQIDFPTLKNDVAAAWVPDYGPEEQPEAGLVTV